MKIYETKTAPNPRRVRIFLAEKGIDMEYVELDIAAGENLNETNRAKNVTTKVPYLELDDGTCIGESIAICRYFEELQPEPPLFGTNPLQKAQVEMWQRRVEFYFLLAVGMSFQHSTGYFKDRMTPVPAWGVESGKSAVEFLDVLETHLKDNTYLCGEYFSVADITLLCALDFARVIKIRLQEQHPNLQRWYALVSSRESAKA
ncbi:MAG: glutathione S-transferase [Pseudomonadales bacterium]|nr:glutathione S-transferase [Pseudomonadales bacterium]